MHNYGEVPSRDQRFFQSAISTDHFLSPLYNSLNEWEGRKIAEGRHYSKHCNTVL